MSTEESNQANDKELNEANCKKLIADADFEKTMKKGNRETISDHYIDSDSKVTDQLKIFKYKVFVRLYAKRVRFKNVSFEHCTFDNCYFNSCVFDTCDFTGCKFIGCNLHQSTFQNCKFDYAFFERTQLDFESINPSTPDKDNLVRTFARTLRMNFQQIGDAKSVNEAISLELSATSSYLKKSWSSTEEYYQEKYGGVGRVYQFGKWLKFKAFDFIWGNGESLTKLGRTIFLIIFCIALYLVNGQTGGSETSALSIFPNAFVQAITWFFSGSPPKGIDDVPMITSFLTFFRLVSIALLTSILVKRLGRR